MYADFYIYTAEALALGASTGILARTNIDTDADFSLMMQTATTIDRRVRIFQTETSTGRSLQDVPAALSACFGDGRRPFRLPTAKTLKQGSSLATLIQDESALLNQVRLAFHGAKVFAQPPFALGSYTAREPFTYTAPFVPVALDPTGIGAIPAGGTGIYNVRIQNDADFEIEKLAITHDIAIPVGSDTVATIELRDESYGRRFSDRPIPVESLGASRELDPLGTPGHWPYVLPVTKLLRAGSLLSCTVRNLDLANALAMRIAFFGAKLYTPAAP